MADTQDNRAGRALGVVLGERGSADQDHAGRALLLALVRLHALGALTFVVDTPCDDSALKTAPAYNMGQSVCIPEDSE